MVRFASSVLFAVFLLAGPGPAHAQGTLDAEARSLFEAGRTAFEAGRFESALDYFRQAYDLSHRPQLLYNVGQSYDRLRRDVQALEAFRAYVAAVPDAPNAGEVRARIALLEAAVASREAAPPPQPTPAPSPADAAATLEDPDRAPVDPAPIEPAGGRSIAEEWWLWTLIAVVVVGAGVGIGVGVALSNPSQQGPLPGTAGSIAIALEGP